MKPTPNSPLDSPAECPPLLAFGAHPDDLEFGCGGVLVREALAGRPVHMVVCSRGEAGTYGTPAQRTAESQNAAAILGATLEFLELGGDAHFEVRIEHTLKIAAILRRLKPALVLAPSLNGNQHPDHARLGQMVRDAARLARYGGVAELRAAEPHAIAQLFFYAASLEAEPHDSTPILYDVSAEETLARWTTAMEAHTSQIRARNYIEMQLSRARLRGLSAGIGHAIALFPNDPIVVDSLAAVGRGARHF